MDKWETCISGGGEKMTLMQISHLLEQNYVLVSVDLNLFHV